MGNPEALMGKLKVRLLLNYPFFGSLASSLKFIPKNVPGMFSITENSIFYDPVKVLTANESELEYFFAREVLHAALYHGMRRRNRDPRIWAVSTEIAINDILRQQGMTSGIEGVVHNHIFNGKSAEQVYDLISSTPGIIESTIRDGENSALRSDMDLASLISREFGLSRKNLLAVIQNSDRETESGGLFSSRMRELFASARMTEMLAGRRSIPASIILDSSLHARLSLRHILEHHSVVSHEGRTFRRFNRKYLDAGIYLPSNKSRMIRAVIVMDVSASISWETASGFISEIRDLVSSLRAGEVIRYIQADADIRDDVIFTGGVPLPNYDWRRHGNGGTDFTPVFSLLQRQGNTWPVLFFTDGRARVPHSAPQYPVIWITTEEELPFGMMLRIGDAW